MELAFDDCTRLVEAAFEAGQFAAYPTGVTLNAYQFCTGDASCSPPATRNSCPMRVSVIFEFGDEPPVAVNATIESADDPQVELWPHEPVIYSDAVVEASAGTPC